MTKFSHDFMQYFITEEIVVDIPWFGSRIYPAGSRVECLAKDQDTVAIKFEGGYVRAVSIDKVEVRTVPLKIWKVRPRRSQEAFHQELFYTKESAEKRAVEWRGGVNDDWLVVEEVEVKP